MRGRISIDHAAVRAATLLAAVVLFGVGYTLLPHPKADTVANVTSTETPGYTNDLDLAVQPDGTITLNDTPITETVRRTVAADEVRLPVISDSIDYWPSVVVTLHLPVPALEGPGMVVPYAIHGATVGPMEISADRQTIVFHFATVEKGSSVSVVVQMARGSLQLGGRATINSITSATDPSRWWLIGISIPLLAMIILWILSPAHRRQHATNQTVTSPPSNLSPAAVGLLVDERFSSDQLAATLLKLAVEGDIQLVSTADGYRIARRRIITHLTPLEHLIVDELRLKLSPINKEESIEEAQQHQLFSMHMTSAISAIYQELEYRGFFAKSYRALRTMWRFIGLITIAVAIGTAALASVVIMDGIVLLPLFFGCFLAGWVVLVKAPHLPRFTSVGRREREQWVAFKSFLASSEPLGGGPETIRLFELYLPYAVTFGVAPQWLHRFKSEFVTIPEWYFSEENPSANEQFIDEIEHIVTKLGRTLSASAIPE